jgi:hypothetical protein
VKSCPVWQAWVEAGRTKKERAARLAEAPAEYHARIISHVRTAFAVRRWAQTRLYGKGEAL